MKSWEECAAEEDFVAEEIGAEVESGLRRLVVAYVLRRKRNAVDWILQECPETIRRRNVTHVEPQFRVVLRIPQYDLLAPVSENVARKARAVLRAVVRPPPLEFARHETTPLRDRIAANDVAAKPAARHIARPPHQERLPRPTILVPFAATLHVRRVEPLVASYNITFNC